MNQNPCHRAGSTAGCPRATALLSATALLAGAARNAKVQSHTTIPVSTIGAIKYPQSAGD